MPITKLIKRVKNMYSRHGVKKIFPLILQNVKHYAKILILERRIGPVKSSVDELQGVETHHPVYLSSIGQTIGDSKHAHAYEPISEKLFSQMILTLPINPNEFTFVDLGSGKGRALFLAAKAGFKEVIGVEFSADLHNIAINNIRNAQGKWPNLERIQLIHNDATNYSPPNTKLVLFLYNPFDATTMEQVTRRWATAMMSNQDDVWIAYQNPKEIDQIESAGAFFHFSSSAGFAFFRRSR